MANRYAVAAGNFSATSTWSISANGSAGASVPTVGDNVFLNGFSVTMDGATINIGTGTITADPDNGGELEVDVGAGNKTITANFNAASCTLIGLTNTLSPTLRTLTINGDCAANMGYVITLDSNSIVHIVINGTVTLANTGMLLDNASLNTSTVIINGNISIVDTNTGLMSAWCIILIVNGNIIVNSGFAALLKDGLVLINGNLSVSGTGASGIYRLDTTGHVTGVVLGTITVGIGAKGVSGFLTTDHLVCSSINGTNDLPIVVFNESLRNTDPGVLNVKTGHNYKICNVSKTANLNDPYLLIP